MARSHFRETILDGNGNVIAGASVYVYEEGTTTPVAQVLFRGDNQNLAPGEDDTATYTQPLLTNSLGVVEFYVDTPQDISIAISKTGYTTQTIHHLPVGPGKPLAVGFPAASAVADTAAQGSSSFYALVDHRHARESFGTPGSSAVADSISAGAATTPARSDHRHGREAWGLSADVATVQPPNGYDAGLLNRVSRADHIHAISPSIPCTLSRFSSFANFSNSAAEQTAQTMALSPTGAPITSWGQGFRTRLFGTLFNVTGTNRTVTFRAKLGGITFMTFVYTVVSGAVTVPFLLETVFTASGGSGQLTDFWGELTIGADMGAAVSTAVAQATKQVGANIGISINYSTSPLFALTAQFEVASGSLGMTGRMGGVELF